MVKDEDPLRVGMPLQNILYLGIINCLDPLFVDKLLLRARVVHSLEPTGIKPERILLSSCTVDGDGVGLVAGVAGWNAHRWFPIDIIVGDFILWLKVVQCRPDVSRSTSCFDTHASDESQCDQLVMSSRYQGKRITRLDKQENRCFWIDGSALHLL